MMEDMPYSLQTLPTEALDVLRYYASANADIAQADDIIEGAGLTERGFGKGIRRLVTKNYVAMSSDQVYRLTDAGKRVVDELREYDEVAPRTPLRPEPRFVRRHLVLITPKMLPVEQTVQIALGFDDASDDEYLLAPANVLLRLTMLNGEPKRAKESTFVLTNRFIEQKFEITAARFVKARVRVEVCQLREDSDEVDFCGGLYVDLPVSTADGAAAPVAYGADVILKEEQ